MSTEVGTGKGTTVRFAEDNPQKKSKGKFKTSVEIVSNLPASGPLRPSDEEKLLVCFILKYLFYFILFYFMFCFICFLFGGN